MPDMPTSETLLDQLLIPQTPPSIIRLYHGFAEEAATRDFSLYEDAYIVLDTETTGLNFKKDALIEIAAVRLRGREVEDTFRTFVDPKRPIPEEITKLTSITDLDVLGAPSAEKAVAHLADFSQGLPVIAHNAVFDRTFITHVSGGDRVSDRWIDSLMLSRIALPRLKSHSLGRMAAAFGITPVTHRAMADVEALCGMWRVILCGLAALPKGLIAALADTQPEVDWPYRPIFSQLALERGTEPFSLVATRRALVGEVPHPAKRDAREGFTEAPSEAEVDEAFSDVGLVGSLYEDYEQRADQLTMAQGVRQALADSSNLVVEAATGTGKSMAYLVPLALFAKENGVTCGVATKTNALTDQLVDSELPALDRALREAGRGGLAYASLKGYDHYPCLRKVERALARPLPEPMSANGRPPESAKADLLNALAVALASACQSPEGDLDSLGIRWRFVPRGMITTTPDECLRRRCPYYPSLCFLHGARQRAQAADILVTNHSLLLRDIDIKDAQSSQSVEGPSGGGEDATAPVPRNGAREQRRGILPPVRHWVVDEAQGFEAEARGQWALEASATGVRSTLESLGNVNSGAIHSLMVQAATVDGATVVQRLLTKAAGEATRLGVLTADFFDRILDVVKALHRRSSYDLVELRIDETLRRTEGFRLLAEAADELAQALDVIVRHLRDAQKLVDEALDVPTGDLEQPRRNLLRLREVLRLVFEGGDERRYAYLEASLANSRRGSERLVVETYDIGVELAEKWYPEMESVTYCSGTLALGNDFSRFCHGVGLDLLEEGSTSVLALNSTFDFDSAMQVVVVGGLPEPGQPNYVRQLADFLYDLHVAMDGSVLTLFTNRKDMESVYRQLRPRLNEHGLPLLMQDRGVNVRRLRERFIEDERASLLALRSFWEGIDAAGDTLRCVVVPKLPFANPAEPLTQEREVRDARAFSHYSLPDAVLLTKQAAGRLIRSSTDVGILVLADGRIRTKRYGRAVVSSMPSESIAEVSAANIDRYVHSWRNGRGR